MALAAEPDDNLETGCRPDTPDGDNLVLDYARAEAAAFGALTVARGGRTLDDDELGLHLRDMAVGTPFGNMALLTRPIVDSDTTIVLERMRSFYGRTAGGPYLVLSPWRTTDWTVHGMDRVGHPPLMFRPPNPVTPQCDGLRIVEVDDADSLSDWERTLIEAYPVPEMQPWEPGAMFDPAMLDGNWRLLVGYEGDEPVATAAAYLAPTLNLVEFVSARAEVRGQGFGARR